MKRIIDHLLVQWKQNSSRKPLILQGARQVGKTFALKEFGSKHFEQTHTLNFEKNRAIHAAFEGSLDPKQILKQLEFELGTPIRMDSDLLVFDEIQECPRALTSLKYFQEDLPALAVCSAGSLLGLHLSERSFPVGKVDFLFLQPLCFEEFLFGIGDDRAAEALSRRLNSPEIVLPELIHNHLWMRLKQYFVVGGLPEVVTLCSGQPASILSPSVIEEVRRKQDTLLLSYLADVAKHSGKLSSMHIERIFRNVPAQLAREVDGSAQKYRFKGEVPGLLRYSQFAGPIDWLKKAGLIIQVPVLDCAQQPLSAHVKENRFKLYFFDVGLLGSIGGIAPKVLLDYDFGTYKGYFAENFVAQELLCGDLFKRRELYSWQEGEAELEFLLERNGEIVPVDVKSGNSTRSKSLQSFAHRYLNNRSNPRIILSAKNGRLDPARGIEYLPLFFARKL